MRFEPRSIDGSLCSTQYMSLNTFKLCTKVNKFTVNSHVYQWKPCQVLRLLQYLILYNWRAHSVYRNLNIICNYVILVENSRQPSALVIWTMFSCLQIPYGLIITVTFQTLTQRWDCDSICIHRVSVTFSTHSCLTLCANIAMSFF